MNVLILTPDRVGSTLLQRLLTVYMIAHEFDKPVINLHELTNGLQRYYNETFNKFVLGKSSSSKDWGYYQTLSEIVELLESVDHYKTARLAQYHINSRGDDISDQVPFYNYLNDNFFIISAQRSNLFEHALSWGISYESKVLNLARHQAKLDTFSDIYKNKITIDKNTLLRSLNRYVDYLKWVDDHFNVSTYYNYEEHLPQIENYILNLNIFNSFATKKTWDDIFGISFSDWNKCHYLVSDLSGLSNQLPSEKSKFYLTHDSTEADQNSFELRSVPTNEITRYLNSEDQQFLSENATKYKEAYQEIDALVLNKSLVTSIPIKLQSMLEKKLIIKNFNECIDIYNEWVDESGYGEKYTENSLLEIAKNEIKFWHSLPKLK